MNPINGVLLIDKSPSMTSHDVVARARRILGLRAIGHAGTLDPLASGLLVLLLGEATKISDYLLNGDKGYELKARLGVTTDSMDMTGAILNEKPVTVHADEIRAMALELQGQLDLLVPIHSAVKVDGQRLYKSAHKGEQPEHVPVREMSFYDVEPIEIGGDRLLVRMRCSKGSFIRSWTNHLGERLGCGASVEALRRIYSTPFSIQSAITLEELEQKWEARSERHGKVIGPAWVALADALSHFKRAAVSGHDEKLLRNGQISKGLQAQLLQFVQAGEALPPVRVVSLESDDLIALLLAEPGQFYKIKRVFLRD